VAVPEKMVAKIGSFTLLVIMNLSNILTIAHKKAAKKVKKIHNIKFIF
jgi:hypothetical protein